MGPLPMKDGQAAAYLDLRRPILRATVADHAEAAATDLPACFVAALRAVRARHPDAFAGIAARVETPFDVADERQRGWFAYRCHLEADLARPLFDSPCSLRQLYQPLRAHRLTARAEPDIDALDARRREIGRHQEAREVVDLERELDRWLAEAGPEDSMRVVCGGPGAGKSSFAKWWAARLAAARDGPRALRIPLHRPGGSDLNLAAIVDRFASEHGPLRRRPLDGQEGERRLVLFLDGLDELVMRGSSGREAAEHLLSQTRELLRSRNEGGRQLRVVPGGREVLVDTLKIQIPLHGSGSV